MNLCKSSVSLITISLLSWTLTTQAIEFSGIYSCNSKSDEKPITYVFNNQLMVRDNEKDIPYEFLSGLTSGELIYVGRALIPKITGVSDLKRWSAIPKYPNERGGINHNPETKEDYALGVALRCHFTNDQEWMRHGIELDVPVLGAQNPGESWAQYLDEIDPSGIDLPIAKLTCAEAKQYASDIGIKDIEHHFHQRNRSRAAKNPNLLQTKLVVINVKQATIWETAVKDRDIATPAPITRKCSVIQMAVPEIQPPSDPIKDQGI